MFSLLGLLFLLSTGAAEKYPVCGPVRHQLDSTAAALVAERGPMRRAAWWLAAVLGVWCVVLWYGRADAASGDPVCAPPAPAAVANVALAEQLVAELWGVRDPVRQVCGLVDRPDLYGYTNDGTVWIAPVAADAPEVALHEVLHAAAMSAGAFDWSDMAREEGITEALTRDLLPTLLLRSPARITVSGISGRRYDSRVADVRLWSGAVCGQAWTSRCARLVRRSLLLANPRPPIPVRGWAP